MQFLGYEIRFLMLSPMRRMAMKIYMKRKYLLLQYITKGMYFCTACMRLIQ